MVFAVPVFAAEGSQSQPSTGTAPTTFEQTKSDHLKRLDGRINSLQEEKTCVQAAKNQDDLNACMKKRLMWWSGAGKSGGKFPARMK
jgi:hypothetical protein